MLELPKEKSKIDKSLNSQNYLIYGPPKVGKTTLASNFPNTIFAATEAGHKHVEIFKVDCNDWDTVRNLGAALANSDHQFKTLVIDIADYFFKHCQDWVCKKNGVQAPADLPYGKGFSLVKDEFIRVVNRFNQIGISLVFISHAKEREMKSKTATWTFMGTTMPGTAENVVSGMCDIILYCYTNSEGQRVMRTKGTQYILAGDRTKPGLPEIMPLDFNELRKHLA